MWRIAVHSRFTFKTSSDLAPWGLSSKYIIEQHMFQVECSIANARTEFMYCHLLLYILRSIQHKLYTFPLTDDFIAIMGKKANSLRYRLRCRNKRLLNMIADRCAGSNLKYQMELLKGTLNLRVRNDYMVPSFLYLFIYS